MNRVEINNHVFVIEGDSKHFQASLTSDSLGDGATVVRVRIAAEQPAIPPVFKLGWTHPISDIQGFWQPGADRSKRFRADWESGYKTKATSSAPVGCFFNANGSNRLTFAFSDALSPLSIKAGVNEESAFFHCSITFFEESTSPMKEYEAVLRFDTRELPYYECLEEVQSWWSGLKGFEPAFVPAVAREPMYSTWYSFHQQLTPEGVEDQCRLAKAVGCEAVIVDDGWQTSDNQRGYAYCGDWRVSGEKFPDFRAHVERVHQLGMKYILWYSVPYIGKKSEAWNRFHNKMLYVDDNQQAGVLDPRYPEVREYLIGIYEKAVEEWDLDGMKLDFVDSFRLAAGGEEHSEDGKDIISVPEAVDRLLTDVIARLREKKPDIMIEFRQSYIGPLMRKYGNMFRASDCPNDAIQNRVRTLDIRLLCGNTAAHADMLMWNPDEPAESAALQIINILFSVPQLSVLLDRIPESHQLMVSYWLAFWKEHRSVLLDGKLEPMNPELLYPIVRSSTAKERVIAVYADMVAESGTDLPDELVVVNGSSKKRLVIDFGEHAGDRQLVVRSCTGEIVRTEQLSVKAGLFSLEIPTSGVAFFTK